MVADSQIFDRGKYVALWICLETHVADETKTTTAISFRIMSKLHLSSTVSLDLETWLNLTERFQLDIVIGIETWRNLTERF
jgi:hypothetical protein